MGLLESLGDGPLNLYELNKEKKPKTPEDDKRFKSIIETLNKDDKWVKEHPKLAEKVFKRLDETNLDEIVRISLFERYPSLCTRYSSLSRIQVTIGDKKEYISEERLKEISPKFKAMLESGMKEAQWGIVIEPPEHVDEETFLTYLNTGEIEIDELNCMDLLILADEHDIPELASKCKEVALSKVSLDNVIDYMQYACHYNFPSVKLACLKFLSENAEKRDFIVLTTDLDNAKEAALKEASSEASSEDLDETQRAALEKATVIAFEEVKDLISLGEQCSESEIELSISKGGYAHVKLSEGTNINKETLDLLKRINKECPIKGLEISAPVSGDNLELLSTVITDLDQLEIHSEKITHIPTSWMRSLKRLDCSSCHLESLDIPNVTKLICRDCLLLKTFDAPKVETLDCSGCLLESLDAPNVRFLDCSNTPLSSLHVPKAVGLICSGCLLLSLDAPNVRFLDCSNNFLNSLHVPEVVNLDCSGCPLKTLTIPKGCTKPDYLSEECEVKYA